MMKCTGRRKPSVGSTSDLRLQIRPAMLPLLACCLLVAGCESSDSIGSSVPIDDGREAEPELAPAEPSIALTPDAPANPSTQTPTTPAPPIADVAGVADGLFVSSGTDIVDNIALYDEDGYGSLDVIRIDLVTRTTAGICIEDDLSGCTLADVLADTNSRDSLKVDIPVHFSATDFADDGLLNNAELRQRGGGSRLAPQKSFRIKLDDKDELWRGERHLQLNKHPFDNSRVRNKLSFDLMSTIPNLPAFRTQFVNLWIDDGQGAVDFGLYTHAERGDERYLERHGLDSDGRLYKAEFFRFLPSDRDTLLIDAEGEPQDEDIFETVLEIENGKDHRNLIAMLDALHDPAQSFESVLDRYFNEKNVLTWLSVNLLLGQQDATRHNYYLYNPEGSEKFFFLPWDYDMTFEEHELPPEGFSSEALKARIQFGYAIGAQNEFMENYYRLPGTHDKIIAATEQLRSQYLSHTTISERAALLSSTTEPFASTAPDITHNQSFSVRSSSDFADKVAFNHTALNNNFSIPLPPTLNVPELVGQQYRFSWMRAHELTGHDLTYELQLATSAEFSADSIVYSVSGIADTPADALSIITHDVPAEQLVPGLRFARLVARSVLEPARYWQVADNHLELDGNIHYGVISFNVE